jgi:Rap1a immunity proteins
MRLRLFAVAAAVAIVPLASHAATQDNFLARTTADLVALCSPGQDDPLRVAAIHFCEGYVVGANQYYQADRTPNEGAMFCLPSPPPSRDDAIAQFVAWARSNTSYMNERPVDGLMRFASATWPCKR